MVPTSPLLVDDSRLALTPVAELALPAVLLRGVPLPAHLVHVYVPSAPTVAFSARDLRSPGIERATAIAREAGFVCGVRSPGGRMVAYDDGAVVVDLLSAPDNGRGGHALFADEAGHHARVLAGLGEVGGAGGPIDTRVGEVPGEYCPGEFSVNVAGRVKVLGSAQRIVRTGSLFSTVIQVRLSDRVRRMIGLLSDALGYALDRDSVGALADVAPDLDVTTVRTALREDHRLRLGLGEGPLPDAAIAHARSTAAHDPGSLPFHVDDWTRAHPLD